MARTAGQIALWVVMVTAVVSAVDYYRRFQLLLNARVTDVTSPGAAGFVGGTGLFPPIPHRDIVPA